MVSVLKLALVVIVLVGLGAFLLGRRSSAWGDPAGARRRASTRPIDTSKAREVGAKVGEATAKAAQSGGGRTRDRQRYGEDQVEDGSGRAREGAQHRRRHEGHGCNVDGCGRVGGRAAACDPACEGNRRSDEGDRPSADAVGFVSLDNEAIAEPGGSARRRILPR